MDYIRIEAKNLVIGETYTDIKPDSKHMKPTKLQLIEKNSKGLLFKKLNNEHCLYVDINKIIPFSYIENEIWYKEIIAPDPSAKN